MGEKLKAIYDDNGILNALLLHKDFEKKGIDFFTNDEHQMQLGYMKREKGYKIEPHIHNPITRTINTSCECLFIKTGRVKIYFYDLSKKPICSEVVSAGDTVLLLSGGHGFLMVEPSEIIEVKQGPYVEQMDKVRFDDDRY
ncbi:hypothetical protein N9Q00_00425 [Amylibacter sp.]|nr:hypothetical protein [Amylibacter sp.]MDB9785466.1 hypothetical protein [Amylibacter sp.]